MNPTQIAGVLAFAGAAAACVRAGRARRERLWFGIAALLVYFALDVVFGWRHHAHDLVDGLLQARGVYGERQSLQWPLIGVAVLGALVTLVTVARLRHLDRLARLASFACLALLWLFIVETISLHEVDAIVYAPAGPVKLIAWLWIAAAAGIAWAAWRAAVRREIAPARRR